jgi:hypothetical protein
MNSAINEMMVNMANSYIDQVECAVNRSMFPLGYAYIEFKRLELDELEF